MGPSSATTTAHPSKGVAVHRSCRSIGRFLGFLVSCGLSYGRLPAALHAVGELCVAYGAWHVFLIVRISAPCVVYGAWHVLLIVRIIADLRACMRGWDHTITFNRYLLGRAGRSQAAQLVVLLEVLPRKMFCLLAPAGGVWLPVGGWKDVRVRAGTHMDTARNSRKSGCRSKRARTCGVRSAEASCVRASVMSGWVGGRVEWAGG